MPVISKKRAVSDLRVIKKAEKRSLSKPKRVRTDTYSRYRRYERAGLVGFNWSTGHYHLTKKGDQTLDSAKKRRKK